MKLKADDKVYIYRFGIHELRVYGNPLSPLKASNEGSGLSNLVGNVLPTYTPSAILTLEEAEKRGFVRKKVKPRKGLRVKYYDKSTDTYCIDHGLYYRSEEEFEYEYPEFLLISFVDDKLNECPPPQETIEWEEI
jgi:hypothetical protein